MRPTSNFGIHLNHRRADLFLQKRFPESRSRRLKVCVHRGLGQRLNKQRNHSFRESGMDGFSHLYIQMHCLRVVSRIPDTRGKQCMCGHNPCCDKSRKQCLWRAICEKRAFPLRRICAFSSLLGDLPSPLNHKFLVSCAPCGRLVHMEYDFISHQFCFGVDLGLYA